MDASGASGASGAADRLLEPLVSRARRAGVFLDFDGVLAPIVDDPDAARPLPGVTDVLERLAERYRLVAAVSGRPTAFLRPLLPASLVISGLYGLEVVRGGTKTDHPSSGTWREVVEDVARASAAHGPAGMRIEPKGVSLTLHYRTHPEIEDDVRRWAEVQAARSGLVARPAKMSVELHPPIDMDKGAALEALAADLDLEAACYVGDDAGDLPAFDALDRMARRGAHVLRVAVASSESPGPLVDRADLILDSPAATLAFLRALDTPPA
jgi:trehalose 6-phosphate phosphatase